MDPADRRLLADLGALVAIPSVSSVSPQWDMPNRPVIDFLASRLEAAGFAVRIDELPHAAGKANLIATLGKGDGGLVLAGHTDTVPCDARLWQSDPYRLDVRGEQLHGLGTTDMKGFLAIVLSACAQAREWRLRAPLVILATADEESTMAGARALTAGGLNGRYAVIGEPTGLRAVRRHKGVLMQRIRVTGRSGHSSDPALGRNALDGMHRVLGTLIEWRTQLSRGPLDDAFAVPYTSLNLGRIAGGDNPNRICGECELDIDLRPLPGTTRETLRSELDQRLSTSLQGLDLGYASEPLFAGIDGLDTPADSPLVRYAEQLTGSPATTAPFATEGPLLRQIGLDVVVLGPGRLEQAHQPDECLDAGSIRPMLDILRGLIGRFCLG